VESIVGVDERGQMVLPKDLRDRAKIRPGDKLAVISRDKDGEICCLYLIKAEQLAERVKDFLGPAAGEHVSR
jgi:AbrB family looped-hinge helix DNA binding protein